MFLKRRNIIAWVLLLIAAVFWTVGQSMLNDTGSDPVYETTHVAATETIATTIQPTMVTLEIGTVPVEPADTSAAPSEPYEDAENADHRAEIWIGMILCFAAAGTAAVAVFLFWQQAPAVGPDGISLLTAIMGTAYYALLNMDYIMWSSAFRSLTTYANVIVGFAVLLAVRELWGWMRARFSISWCLAHRIAKRCPMPQMSLLVFVGWIILALAVIVYYLLFFMRYGMLYDIPVWGAIIAGIFGFVCLWKYGNDLEHFKKQLNNYQRGLPITVGGGAFSQTEAQLLEVQAQHEEAVRAAVTSERFKVELISNVSHDLRTPLTSILGYSELLQQETLSPEGREQLRRLHQKAGYMNDLVESLFELTKVSSGAAESKKDEIDLVRLLEQTIGLFDDQLVNAGLTVRRSYGADAIPIITDGARMHQVFANLLGNAIKYALAGTRIYLEVKETEHSYRIRMMNTASYEMDFKPDEIMQRFARGDKARSTKGSGLGLAIAQTYTESVGGTFRVSVDGDQFSAIVELPKLLRNL